MSRLEEYLEATGKTNPLVENIIKQIKAMPKNKLSKLSYAVEDLLDNDGNFIIKQEDENIFKTKGIASLNQRSKNRICNFILDRMEQ